MTTTAGIFLLPNGTFFIELIVSLVLLFLIYKYVLPPINKALTERQEKIRDSLEAADKARSDAEAADDERRNGARRGAPPGTRNRRHGQSHG